MNFYMNMSSGYLTLKTMSSGHAGRKTAFASDSMTTRQRPQILNVLWFGSGAVCAASNFQIEL